MNYRTPSASGATSPALNERAHPAHLSLAGKRILIIVENESVPFDRRVWQQACALSAAGALVSVISPMGKQDRDRYQEIDGIHVYRHPLSLAGGGIWGYLAEYGTSLFWQLRLALRIFRRHGFDVIHACNPPDLIFLIALPFKLLRIKLIFDHHDISPELYEAKFGRRDILWRLLRIAERLTFKTADVAIATNESYRQIAMERGGKKPADVFVVRNGPDLSRIRLVSPNHRWKQGRAYLVGYVGVMGDQEGIDILLQSIAYITHTLNRHDIQFCLVGGGPSLGDYKQEAVRLQVAEVVTFAGRTSDETLLEILSTADVCVNPDRVTSFSDQSTMIKVMEYMALAKPVVQFDVAEGRFTAESASLYARPNDPIDLASQILKLIDSPELRSEMGTAGRIRIETKLAWEHQIPNLVAAYQHVLIC